MGMDPGQRGGTSSAAAVAAAKAAAKAKAAGAARRKRAQQSSRGALPPAVDGWAAQGTPASPRPQFDNMPESQWGAPMGTTQWGDIPEFQWGVDVAGERAIQDALSAAQANTPSPWGPNQQGPAPSSFGAGGPDAETVFNDEMAAIQAAFAARGDGSGAGGADLGDGGAAAAAAAAAKAETDAAAVAAAEAAAEAARVAQEEADALAAAGLEAEAAEAAAEAARLADLAARQQACAAQEGGVWNAATGQCDVTPVTASPMGGGGGAGDMGGGMGGGGAAPAPAPAPFPGAGAYAPDVAVDPAIEAQAAEQMPIVEKALQTKNRSIQQALQAGLLSISDAQTAWDEARSEIYQDFLTEQGLIQSGFATEQEETASRRTTDRTALLQSLNAAGVDSGLVADELAMIDEMFQGGATEQGDYLDAMGRIGEMSNADRRMMGQGIFGGYEQNLRSGMRDLGLATNFEAADESQLARERGLQARGLSEFTGVDPETLYAALYAGVDVPGMAYGTSEREAGQVYGTGEREAGQTWQTGERTDAQTWAEGESELDRALATDKFDESVRQFNWLGGRQDAATRTGISQFNQQFAREGSQYDTTQTQYQDALDLEAGQYATKRDDIADALGLEAERFELGREMDPASEFAGMTTAQQREHQRLTAKALASAGADVKKGSLLSQVASVMLLEGRDVGEIKTMMDQVDGYLADNMRGDDLSDENVLAALMSLGQTDIIYSVLGLMGSDQMLDLIDTMGGAGGTTGGASPYAPDVGQAESETIFPEVENENLTTGARLQGTRLKPVTGSGMMGQGSRSESVYRDTVGNSFTQAEVDRIAASMPPGWTDPAYEPGPLGYIDYVARIGWVFDENGKAGEEVSRLTPSGGGQLGLGRFG